MDERMENARAVCDKQYLYIRNYMPYVPWMQHLNYLWKMKATQAWEEHVQSGKASEVQSRFFKPKGWTEELYDMRKDPDNVDNLIGNPEYGPVANRMRAALRRQQLRFIDSGLLPESEMVKRAKDNGMTIHDMVRDPKLYNLPALLDAADLALAEKQENLPVLHKLLANPDCGLRYWGMAGCFLLSDPKAGLQGLKDESHEVRAMAAWLLIKTGEKKKGLQCLEDLLEENSYAALTVLNIVDWLGEDGQALRSEVEAFEPKTNYEERMRSNLISKFNN